MVNLVDPCYRRQRRARGASTRRRLNGGREAAGLGVNGARENGDGDEDSRQQQQQLPSPQPPLSQSENEAENEIEVEIGNKSQNPNTALLSPPIEEWIAIYEQYTARRPSTSGNHIRPNNIAPDEELTQLRSAPGVKVEMSHGPQCRYRRNQVPQF
ncbi:hypothetical protein EMCG_07752 [[Emmonsia] crescens]|uniref:Uncharacterized protein n=1 Tax=[Emmonsia] crescens TaxID=73230 RepID=A0A0G2I7P0_9EURO|nr:hypothetical protein EMCG_07752 [Emmonsia crescens UAMH 3008]